MNFKREKERMLQNHLKTMKFLNDSSEEILYLCDIEEQKVYFSNDVSERYSLPPLTDGVYDVSQIRGFVCSKEDKQIFLNPDAFGGDEERVLHQEYRIVNGVGEIFWIHSTEKLQCDENGNPMWIVGRIAENSLEQKMDPMTGLYNTKKLIEDLNQCLNMSQSGFLMVLGIDNFKHINNKYGRGFGNHVLKNVAEVLEGILDNKLRVYRLDSDKFAINAVKKTREEVESIYRDIQEKISIQCTLSSGVSQYEEGLSKDVDVIYQQAENALDRAKKNGKNTQEFFSEVIYEEQLESIELQDELRKSITNNFEGFSLNYQPQIYADTFDIYGAEALLRYQSPSKGAVSPVEFIPILEQTRLITVVGEWVLREALLQCKKWREYYPSFRISVNFSYIQLRSKLIADHIIRLLKDTGLPGEALTLEVTESVQLQDYQFFNKIFYKLEKYGVEISIDDFGTGYSSLSYLKSIAIDEIKIDRCFVAGIQHSAYNYHLLSNMIELAHSAQIRVCCEGVETEEELRSLKELHPDMLQGYLFLKPCTVERFEERYFMEDTESYREKEEQKFRYLQADTSGASLEQKEIAEREKMAAIIDGMEELIYVCDPESQELLYLNDAGRALTGVYDYRGSKCYEVLHNRKTPCEVCNRDCMNYDSYHVCELYNESMQKHFITKAKMISWSGQNARLMVCIDITEKEITSKKIQDKLEFEQNIVAATKMLVKEKDRSKAISSVLELVGEFYDAARAYLFEIQRNQEFWDNTYEWCAEGVIPQIDFLQNVPISTTERWLKRFYQGESIVLEDVESIKEIAPDEYEILKAQDIKSVLVSPIWRNSQIIGFIGVDDPKKHIGDLAQVQTMAYFVEDRLQKDDTKKRLGEILRLQDFYKASLSEKIAYMEIDLETRQILDIGGLWNAYREEALEKNCSYSELMLRYKESLIHPEDKAAYASFIGENIQDGMSVENNHTKKLEYRRLLDGRMQWMEITAHIFVEQYSERLYALLYLRNIDAEKKRELEQEEAAARDHLTGVFNRRTFEYEVKNHMAEAERDSASTLILLDVDNFKLVNDTYGHAEGDRVLKQLSDVLMTTFRKKDLLGRLGGDEFMIFLKNVSDREIINRRIEEFRTSFAKANFHHSTCSIGITKVAKKGFSYDECLKRADFALYQSKEKGKNTYSYYED